MDFNHYFTNEEIEALLKDWAGRFPQVVRLATIGESYEKRPIWLLTLTNTATGPDLEKPAVWIDANIHATEVTGATAALHLAHTLLEGYGQDAQITRLLDQGVDNALQGLQGIRIIENNPPEATPVDFSIGREDELAK